MFRGTDTVTVPPTGTYAPGAEQLVALSVLRLDLDPGEEWATFLGRRAIAIVPDTLGRDSIGHDAARRLLDERRADELRQRKLAALQQERQEEADKLRRAQIWTGLSADAIPIGVLPVVAMTQAVHDARPRRRSLLEESRSGSAMTFHPIRNDPNDDES